MKGRPCLARKEEEGGGDRDLAFALTLSPLTDEEKEDGGRGGSGRASEGAPSPASASSARPRPLSLARYNLHSAGLDKAGYIHILHLDVTHFVVTFVISFYQQVSEFLRTLLAAKRRGKHRVRREDLRKRLRLGRGRQAESERHVV